MASQCRPKLVWLRAIETEISAPYELMCSGGSRIWRGEVRPFLSPSLLSSYLPSPDQGDPPSLPDPDSGLNCNKFASDRIYDYRYVYIDN